MKSRLRSTPVERAVKEAYEDGKKFRRVLQTSSTRAEPMALHARRPDGRTREGKAWIRGARGDRLRIVRAPRERDGFAILGRFGPLGGFLDIT